MRVLFFSHGSGAGGFGGAELSMLQLIDAWRARRPDIEIIVVARTPRGSLQGELDARSVRHHALDFSSWVRPEGRLHGLDRLLELRMDSWATSAIVDIIRDIRPDLVVTNTIVAPWGALAARLCGVPHAWFIHEYGDRDHGFTFRHGREATLRDIDLLSDLVVANSEAVSDSLSAFVAPERLMVSYPLVDIDRVRRLGAETAPHDGGSSAHVDLRTVLVGRLSRTKGQWRLARAVAALRDEGLHVEARFIGSATEADRDELIGLVRELGVDDRVYIEGETANPFAAIAASDLGIMASDCEAFGRVTVEYMSLGRAVIAARTGANPELIDDGEAGWLVDIDDETDLVRALREACADPAEVRRRGENARRWVDERLHAAHPVGALLESLERLMVESPRPMMSLPTVLREWIDLPRELDAHLRDFHEARVAGMARPEWRVGRFLTLPLRALSRWTRRSTEIRSRS